ncbi:diguanylate cyclase [Amphritea atlantica]|uniref:diguanylate cyclase n=1 Tax=Amphritea atlantica TaxID=355243 RepID=A0ABY5GW41_9GAMM|nr:diguanylate cyclase [Amphritea atlantica]
MKSNPQSHQSLYRSIRHRYLLGVLIIAVLSTAAYYTLLSSLSDSESTAYIVNLSGRQRMLSQHIALDAHRIYDAMLAGSPASDELTSQMRRNIHDMEAANHKLSSGLLSENWTVDLSTPCREIYFGRMNLYARVDTYLNLAAMLLSSSRHKDAQLYFEQINNSSEQLLTDLNTAVNQYQLEGEQRLNRLENLELLVWITTLIALLLEIVFIFRPMLSIVYASLKAQTEALESLEEIVESRTLKLEISNKKLKDIATHDPLTKLRNRLTLESDIESLIGLSKTHQIHFALCMIDIDHFKHVNDSYGHQAGDYILQELALLLKQETREYDHIYRAGGEEFVLVLNRIDFKEATDKLERIRLAIQQNTFIYGDNIIPLTISAGIYHSNQFVLSKVHDIFRIADTALYAAKHAGRNCIRIAQRENDDISLAKESSTVDN